MSAEEKQYCWSSCDEAFTGRFDSVEAVIADAVDTENLEQGDTVEVGEVAESEFNPDWLADGVLEALADQAYEEVGEAMEGWPKLSEEDRRALGWLIIDFVKAKDAPRFYKVINVKSHQVSAADVEKQQ